MCAMNVPDSSKPECSQSDDAPDRILRGILEACADCDICRFQMDENCLFFPELYRLYDKEKETGIKAGCPELVHMLSLCTLCGLCPCPNIRADIIRGKTEHVGRNGLPFANRMLADIQSVGKISGWFSDLVNIALNIAPLNRIAKKAVGIHPGCQLPRIPKENFFSWAKKKGLCDKPGSASGVAYFAGCTAAYLFPQVAMAAVAALQFNGVSVYVPPQQCCGMPTLLEGDKTKTLRRLRFNMDILLELAESGFDPVFSCPTCCYVMKVLLKEGAYYSEAYQRIAGAGTDEMRIPRNQAGGDEFVCLQKTIYKNILKDNSYFSILDPLKRIALADSASIIGDYLVRKLKTDRLNNSFVPVPGRFASFTSCHQREQGGISPYKSLLDLIPGLSVIDAGNSMDCCGMGGNLGIKKDFNEASIRIGESLFHKIRAVEPSAIVADCLGCRIQFMQMLPYPVYHPLELIARSYAGGNLAHPVE